MARKQATDFDQALLDLYDEYVHSTMTRRCFLDRAAALAVGGMCAASLAEALLPDYALAQQVAPDDSRIVAAYVDYPSLQGSQTVRGLLAMPVNSDASLPAVVVVHENRGLNPYIEDVARRLAVAGFLALAPDALTSLGGYPGSDDEGKLMQQTLDPAVMTADFIAAAEYLREHPQSSGQVGVIGFCFGGGMANTLAVRLPWLKAAVPFYGRQPASADVPQIKAALLLHYAELDPRINAGWPEYEAALRQAGVDYQAHMYAGVNHGFHNDTTPRYDAQAAELAWQRTLEFLTRTLT